MIFIANLEIFVPLVFHFSHAVEVSFPSHIVRGASFPSHIVRGVSFPGHIVGGASFPSHAVTGFCPHWSAVVGSNNHHSANVYLYLHYFNIGESRFSQKNCLGI